MGGDLPEIMGFLAPLQTGMADNSILIRLFGPSSSPHSFQAQCQVQTASEFLWKNDACRSFDRCESRTNFGFGCVEFINALLCITGLKLASIA